MAGTGINSLFNPESLGNANFNYDVLPSPFYERKRYIDYNNIDWFLSKREEKLSLVFPLWLYYLKQYGGKVSEHDCIITAKHATNSTIDFTSFAIL